MTTTKLELLKNVTGEDFFEIQCNNKPNQNFYQCEKGEAFIIENEKYQDYLIDAAKTEIAFLPIGILTECLPEKFHNKIILENLKELCKFDRTILLNHVKNMSMYLGQVIMLRGEHNLILENSKLFETKEYKILYAEN